jgi:hypothetical protein
MHGHTNVKFRNIRCIFVIWVPKDKLFVFCWFSAMRTPSIRLLKINIKESNNYSFTNKSAVNFVKDCLSSQCIH